MSTRYVTRRLSAGSGIAGGLLMLLAVGAIGDAPDPHDSAQSVISYFHVHSASMYVSMALSAAAFPLIVAFLFGLRDRVRRCGPIATSVSTTAGLALLAVLGLNALIYLNLAWQADTIDAAQAKALFVFTTLSPVAQGPLCAALFTGIAFAGWKARAMPRWHSIVSAVAAAVAASSAFAFAQSGYFYADVQQAMVDELFLLWLLVTSVVFWRERQSAAGTSPQG